MAWRIHKVERAEVREHSVMWFRLGGTGMASLFAATLFAAVAASAEATPTRCVVGSHPDAIVTLSGKLLLQSSAGPPNYESVAQGDVEEKIFILKLSRGICFEDGEFADGSERFDRIHVSTMEPGLSRILEQAIGEEVVIAGHAVGAHTAHHRAPVVLFAKTVMVRENRTSGR